MPKQPRGNSDDWRPVWVIALSLLVLAVLVGLIVVEFLSPEPKLVATGIAPAEIASAASRDSTVPRVNTPTRRNQDRTVLREVKPPASAEAQPEPIFVSAVSANDSAASEPAPILMPLLTTAIASNATLISGRVTLRGTPPPEKPINMDAPCARLQTNPPTTQFYVTSADGGLADVLVYLLSNDKLSFDPSHPPINELVFDRCRIEPYVTAVTRGQPFKFRNADNLLHSVRLSPTNSSARSFTLTQHSSSPLFIQSRPEAFVRVRCDVHPWESAYISILDHPYFAITDTNGNFAIRNPPPGDYTVIALHRKARFTNSSPLHVTVKLGQPAFANFTLDVPTEPTLAGR